MSSYNFLLIKSHKKNLEQYILGLIIQKSLKLVRHLILNNRHSLVFYGDKVETLEPYYRIYMTFINFHLRL